MSEEIRYQHSIVCLNKDGTRNEDLDIIMSLSNVPPAYIEWDEKTRYQYTKTTPEDIHQYNQM